MCIRDRYRLCAHGPGGNSTHVSCGTAYTTPSAPSRVEAVKAGATEVTLRVCHFLLMFGRLCHDVVVFHFRGREI